MDTAKFLTLFLTEADEQLERLEQGILELEERPTPDVIQLLFRTAHTLKGSAGAMGFQAISGLTHGMENVLDHLRNGRLAVTGDLVNLLLACLDALKSLREELGESGKERTDTAELSRRLDDAGAARSAVPATDAPPSPPPPTALAATMVAAPASSQDSGPRLVLGTAEQAAVAQGRDEGLTPLRVRIRVAEDCLMRGARMLTLLRRIEAEDQIVAMAPSLDRIEREEFDRDVVCAILARRTPEAVAALVKAVADVERVDVAPLDFCEGAGESQAAVRDTAALPAAGADDRVSDLGPEARGLPPEELAARRRQSTQTIRVDVERLDELMNLVGELVIDRIRLVQIVQEMGARTDLGAYSDALEETSHHLARISTDLQAQIMKARMLPIEQLFSRFPRFVRDLAQKHGKQIDLVIEGRETELDRSVIEQIGDPLIHLLRNAIDHGIEPPEARLRLGKPAAGRVRLAASQEEESIVIVVEDDGGGIDAERVRARAVSLGVITEEQAQRLSAAEALDLIFVAGLSTAKAVSDVSGRGVGMDIVRSNVQAIGGNVTVASTPGRGTRFVLKLPLTLAIVRALLVRCSGETYALPLSAIYETIEIPVQEIRYINGREATLLRGAVLPLAPLTELLGSASGTPAATRLCVVAGSGAQRVGLLVDGVIGEQEVVIKPLGSFVGDIPGVSGATILGDGRVALILDVAALIRLSGRRKEMAHVG